MATPSLFWKSLEMSSPAIEGDSDIWSIIKAKMQEAGLSDVKKNPSDVNGHTQDTIVAVTFVKRGPHDYVLIIMAAGNDALKLRDKVFNKLKNVNFL